MNKADYKFHRDKKEQIEYQSRPSQNLNDLFYRSAPANQPIHIPRKKKKK